MGLVIAGNAAIAGSVECDLMVVGGSIEVQSKAVIAGDVYAIEGTVEILPGGMIEGDVYRLELREVAVRGGLG